MEKQFFEITSLIGDPVRSKVMWTLMDGRAYTATELSLYADTTPQNISMHLARLVQADLLSVEKQGRHRYYRFSRPEVAYAIEALTNLVPHSVPEKKIREDEIAIRFCRTCYDHLAGKVSIALTGSLLKQKIIEQERNTFSVSAKGEKWLSEFGIDIASLQQQRRSFIRPCLDWSERQYHLAGSLGAALLEKMLSESWIRKTANSRAVIVTGKGQKALLTLFKINL